MAINYQPPSRHARDKHRDAGRVTARLNAGGKAFDVSIDDPVSGENVTRFCCTSLNWIARKLLWLSVLLVIYCIITCMA